VSEWTEIDDLGLALWLIVLSLAGGVVSLSALAAWLL